MDELIKKKKEYLLRLLKYEQYEETNNINKNNNLSTLVETAIEIIKDNKNKVTEYNLKKTLDEIQNTVRELHKRDEPLTDNQYSILLDENRKILKHIEPNEETKEEYDTIMTKLNTLSSVASSNNANVSNVSKIVQTALDVIIYNKNIITNKEINETIKEQYVKISNRIKLLINKVRNIKKQTLLDITNNNNKQIIKTAIDILNQTTSSNNLNERQLVNTAVDLLSQNTNVTSTSEQDATTTTTTIPTSIDDIYRMEHSDYVKIEIELNKFFRNIKDNYTLFKNFINEPNDKEINDKNTIIQKLRNEFDILMNENSSKIELLEKAINDIINKNSLLKTNTSNFINEAENQIAILDDKIKDNNVLFNNNSKEIEKITNDIKNRQNQIQIGETRIETIKNKIDETSDDSQLKILQNSLQQKQETNNKLENDLIELNNDKELLENKNNTLIDDNNKLKEEKISINDNIKENEEENIEEKTKLLEENKNLIEKIKNINDLNEIYIINMGRLINNNLEELDNLKTEIDATDTKDKQLLNVTNDLLNMIPTSAVNPEELYNLLPNIGNFNDILSNIKENIECPTTKNLIGKIDNECLYFNDENKIDVTTEDYDKIKAIMDENNKWKENVKNVLIK